MAAEPHLRLADAADAAPIGELMRRSVAELFPRFYDAQQTASSVEHVAVLDDQLIADRTYFVIEADGEVVACGGWSRRDRLYSGSGSGAGDEDARLLDPASEPARVRAMFVRADWTRRGLGRRILEACVDAARREGFATLALMATLPGVPLYQHFGFANEGYADVVLADGVALACAAMTMPIPER